VLQARAKESPVHGDDPKKYLDKRKSDSSDQNSGNQVSKPLVKGTNGEKDLFRYVKMAAKRERRRGALDPIVFVVHRKRKVEKVKVDKAAANVRLIGSRER